MTSWHVAGVLRRGLAAITATRGAAIRTACAPEFRAEDGWVTGSADTASAQFTDPVLGASYAFTVESVATPHIQPHPRDPHRTRDFRGLREPLSVRMGSQPSDRGSNPRTATSTSAVRSRSYGSTPSGPPRISQNLVVIGHPRSKNGARMRPERQMEARLAILIAVLSLLLRAPCVPSGAARTSGGAAPQSPADVFAGLPPDSARLKAVLLKPVNEYGAEIDAMEPSVSPDGRYVTFRGRSDVFLYDLPARKTATLCHNSNPHDFAWNTAGTLIAFTGACSPLSSSFCIWLVRPDGSGLRRVPGSGPNDQHPIWSADGRSLVWTRGRRLWQADTSGRGGRYLTKTPSNPYHLEFAGGWTADRARLRYLSGSEMNGDDWRLRLVGRDSTDDVPDVSRVPAVTRTEVGALAHGSLIYRRVENAIEFIEPGAGGRVRRCFVQAELPVWSPSVAADRSVAVFEVGDEEESDLWLVELRPRGPVDGTARHSPLRAARSGLHERFEGTVFPPSGWGVRSAGTPRNAALVAIMGDSVAIPVRWQRTTDPLYVIDGSGSALIEGQARDSIDEGLVSPFFLVTPSDTSLRFRWLGNPNFAKNAKTACSVRRRAGDWISLWTLDEEVDGLAFQNPERVVSLRRWSGDSVQVRFRVAGVNGADFGVDDIETGSFPITGPPGNDRCADAITLRRGMFRIPCTTCYAANDRDPAASGPSSCLRGGDAGGGDVFYSVPARAGDTLHVRIPVNVAEQTELYLLKSFAPGAACLAGKESSGGEVDSSLTYVFQEVGSYVLVVDSSVGDCATFELSYTLRGARPRHR